MTSIDLARAPHLVDPTRWLRSGAWLLQRSWRHPQRLPAGWRSERFACSVDSVRRQLAPIRTLTALVDSYARESRHISWLCHAPAVAVPLGPASGLPSGSPVELAYLMRWIELDRGRALHDWRTLCERAP